MSAKRVDWSIPGEALAMKWKREVSVLGKKRSGSTEPTGQDRLTYKIAQEARRERQPKK